MSDADRVALIHQTLEAALAPSRLEIVDESHRHAGHAGARAGGHFVLTIVSDQFAGRTPIECHRLIYQALGALMGSEIHALSIRASAPAER